MRLHNPGPLEGENRGNLSVVRKFLEFSLFGIFLEESLEVVDPVPPSP